MRCSSNPQTQNQVHCKFELNRLPSTAATGSKNHSAHATHQSPNVDQLNITEVQISIESRCKNLKKKCWQIQLNGKNQPNHRSEPAEPLDSPHESPISKRKFCSRRRLSTRTREHAPFFSHLVPGPLRKLQFSFCKTSLIKSNKVRKVRKYDILVCTGLANSKESRLKGMTLKIFSAKKLLQKKKKRSIGCCGYAYARAHLI